MPKKWEPNEQKYQFPKQKYSHYNYAGVRPRPLKEEDRTVHFKGFLSKFSKFPQFLRALLLRVLRVERREGTQNEALDESYPFPGSCSCGSV